MWIGAFDRVKNRHARPSGRRPRNLKETGSFSSCPKNAEQKHQQSGPRGMSPKLDPSFLRGGLRERGDCGEDRRGIGAFDQPPTSQLEDLAQDVEFGGLATFFAARAMDRNDRIE